MLRRLNVLPVLACSLAFGQSTETKLAFEAASLKPSSPGARPFAMTMGGPGTKDPGRIRYSNTSLKAVLLIAYGVNDFQIAGPGWLETDRFDIDATMPADTTQQRLQEMLRNLLLERFRIALHRETRDAPAYALVIGKNGPKMAHSAPGAAQPDGIASEEAMPPQQFERDRDGFPKLPPGGPPGILQFVALNRGRLQGRLQTMGDLTNRLSYLLGRPVTDGTALTGKYDFSLTFATEGTALGRPIGPPLPLGGDTPNADQGETPPDLFGAVQSQLGLKLEVTRAPVEIIVIDHAERTPVAN